jgi:phosphoribosylanthranilate isomerase
MVGVFVNEALERLLSIARSARLDVVQLSGDEPPEYVAACSREYPVIKALRFPKGFGLRSALGVVDGYISAIPEGGKRARFLVDAYRPGEYGGTGTVADWRLASALSARREIILAGGLGPDNVRSAIAAVSPWGVDVSSGVEAGGTKDAKLIRAFLQAAKLNRSGRK